MVGGRANLSCGTASFIFVPTIRFLVFGFSPIKQKKKGKSKRIAAAEQEVQK